MPESEGSRARPPEGHDSHGERHPNGWRVRPGPDGRGAPPQPQQPRPRLFGPGFLFFLVVLMLLNIVVASTLTTHPSRVRIPYSPTFLNQVNAGNVSSISSKGTTVQGN
ncbi:MAG: ATP-dependent zinc metalloprotease FtsH, partial [Solirubrobacteraceae bacterium]